MRAKKGQKLSSLQKENLEANFRKLWLIEKVDGSFMVHSTKIKKEWDLPLAGGHQKAKENIAAFYQRLYREDDAYFNSDEFTKVAHVINSMAELELPKQAKKDIFANLFHNLPSLRFNREAKELRERFDFEVFWQIPLSMYIITGEIYAPYEKKSKQTPSGHIKDDWKIFILTSQKEAQHSFLKKQGSTTKQIAELQENTHELPIKLIYNNLNIAQEVWGDWEEGLDDNALKKMDRKMQSRVKKRYERFRKLFVSLSDEDMKILKSINLPFRKS